MWKKSHFSLPSYFLFLSLTAPIASPLFRISFLNEMQISGLDLINREMGKKMPVCIWMPNLGSHSQVVLCGDIFVWFDPLLVQLLSVILERERLVPWHLAESQKIPTLKKRKKKAVYEIVQVQFITSLIVNIWERLLTMLALFLSDTW